MCDTGFDCRLGIARIRFLFRGSECVDNPIIELLHIVFVAKHDMRSLTIFCDIQSAVTRSSRAIRRIRYDSLPKCYCAVPNAYIHYI